MKRMLAACLAGILAVGAAHAGVRIKDIARIEGTRDYALVGYGLVVGLAGSGDSDKNRATRQSLVNVLKNFNVSVSEADINSHNTAAVMVTASMHAYSENGDKMDVQVSSLGDARSLVGGTLLLTPLYGADKKMYALAQGSVSVGGYYYELNGNSVQKNHPTVGLVPRGGSIERATQPDGMHEDHISVILNEPDFTTAERVANAIRLALHTKNVSVVHAARVDLLTPPGSSPLPDIIARIESTEVEPDEVARVVVNERTGTVVAGAHVRLGEVNVSQGDVNVTVSTKYLVSQPGMLVRPGDGIATTVVPDTSLDVQERNAGPVQLQEGATVADLVEALYRVHLTTRDVITVLQAVKRAGALHAELVVQ